jgi:hypothetical protein
VDRSSSSLNSTTVTVALGLGRHEKIFRFRTVSVKKTIPAVMTAILDSCKYEKIIASQKRGAA